MDYVNPKNIVIFALFICVVIWVSPSYIYNFYLYYANAKSLNLYHYTIKFQRGDWALRSENDEFYKVAKNGEIFLQIAKKPSSINYNEILQNCKKISDLQFYSNIDLYKFACQEVDEEVYYFISQSRDFFAKSLTPLNEENQKIFDEFFKKIQD